MIYNRKMGPLFDALARSLVWYSPWHLGVLHKKDKPTNANNHNNNYHNKIMIIIIGERAKRARHSQVCSIENRDIYIIVRTYVTFAL